MTAVNCMSTFGTRTSGASRRSRNYSLPSWRMDCRNCASPPSPAPVSSSASSAVKAATTVVEADYAHDLSDVPPELLFALHQSGCCLSALEDALMEDDVIYDK